MIVFDIITYNFQGKLKMTDTLQYIFIPHVDNKFCSKRNYFLQLKKDQICYGFPNWEESTTGHVNCWVCLNLNKSYVIECLYFEWNLINIYLGWCWWCIGKFRKNSICDSHIWRSSRAMWMDSWNFYRFTTLSRLDYGKNWDLVIIILKIASTY